MNPSILIAGATILLAGCGSDPSPGIAYGDLTESLESVLPVDKSIAVWHCAIAIQTSCGGGECSKISPAKISIRLLLEQNVYERCDISFANCDSYKADYAHSGGFLTINVLGSPTMARLSGDGHFSDVAALGHTYFVSDGTCDAVQ